MHGVISLPEKMSCDKLFFCTINTIINDHIKCLLFMLNEKRSFINSIVSLRKYIFLNSVKVNIIMVQSITEMT